MIKQLGPEDLAAYRKLRLAGLREHPEYFGASIRDEKKNTDKVYLDGFGVGNPTFFVLGKFVEGRLVGVIGFRRFTLDHLKHKASLWGMYVAPGHRRQGIGAALVEAYLAKASQYRGLEVVQLAVERGNRGAQKLYAKSGFRKFAEETRGLKVGGKYFDEIWMRVELG